MILLVLCTALEQNLHTKHVSRGWLQDTLKTAMMLREKALLNGETEFFTCEYEEGWSRVAQQVRANEKEDCLSHNATWSVFVTWVPTRRKISFLSRIGIRPSSKKIFIWSRIGIWPTRRKIFIFVTYWDMAKQQ